MAGRKAYLLRIDPKLWEALEKWAADEFRSVNGQIEFVLARAVEAACRGRRSTAKRVSAREGRGSAPPPPRED